MKIRLALPAITFVGAMTFGLHLRAEPVAGTAGPYAVVMEHDAAHPEHTVYRPADLALVKAKLPFVAFGNGGCLNIGNLERRFLAEVASHGYIVSAPGKIEKIPENFGPANTGGLQPTQAQPGQMRRAIDWALQQAQSGSWQDQVNTQRIAVMGASCGGLEAIATGGDPRVHTVVVLNSGIIRDTATIPRPAPANQRPGRPMQLQLPGKEADLANLHTPVLYLIGGPKDVAFRGSELDFAQIQRVPLFNGNIDVGHSGTFSQPHGGAMGTVVIAWLDWQLKGNSVAAQTFQGPDCRLCKDPAWQIKKKNLP